MKRTAVYVARSRGMIRSRDIFTASCVFLELGMRTRKITIGREANRYGFRDEFLPADLREPMLAEFKDGTLMLDMRGSNKGLDAKKYPLRRWISLSKDHGKTWSEVRDLRYDDGEQFYSPAAHSRLVRSSKTGKQYWLGNISSAPPKSNGVRYPLYIAEIDEEKAALRKSTLTLIDDRQPTDRPSCNCRISASSKIARLRTWRYF